MILGYPKARITSQKLRNSLKDIWNAGKIIILVKMKPSSSASLRPDEAMMTVSSGFATTGASSLKGKLQGLEEHIKAVTEELNFHKKEVNTLKSEKESLERTLNMKLSDARKSLGNEIYRVEEEMKRHFAH
jgi:predicted  nucleic acid-binding Zn-ribbon protein